MCFSELKQSSTSEGSLFYMANVDRQTSSWLTLTHRPLVSLQRGTFVPNHRRDEFCVWEHLVFYFLMTPSESLCCRIESGVMWRWVAICSLHDLPLFKVSSLLKQWWAAEMLLKPRFSFGISERILYFVLVIFGGRLDAHSTQVHSFMFFRIPPHFLTPALCFPGVTVF